MLIFNDYETFEQIYGPNPQLVKDSYRYAAVSASHTPNLVTENDPHKANMKRKAHLDMWNNRSLKVAEPRLHALLDTFVSTLTSPNGDDPAAEDVKSWGKTVNLTELGTSFGFDIMMSMVTGESPNLMTDPEKRWMPDASKHVSWRALTVSSVVVRISAIKPGTNHDSKRRLPSNPSCICGIWTNSSWRPCTKASWVSASGTGTRPKPELSRASLDPKT
jgi:hypothetical protein